LVKEKKLKPIFQPSRGKTKTNYRNLLALAILGLTPFICASASGFGVLIGSLGCGLVLAFQLSTENSRVQVNAG